MKVESQKIGPCKVKLLVNAGPDETREDYNAVIKIFDEKGRVPGFRPGKVPRAVLLRTFQKQIKEEIELWKWNYVATILSDVKEFCCLPVYLTPMI